MRHVLVYVNLVFLLLLASCTGKSTTTASVTILLMGIGLLCRATLASEMVTNASEPLLVVAWISLRSVVGCSETKNRSMETFFFSLVSAECQPSLNP